MDVENDARTGVEVVRSEERLRVDTEWVPSERVLVRRRVVELVRQVEVTVRREELVVERTPLRGATASSSPQATSQPVVIVLSEEVPDVRLTVQPYERVTVSVHADIEQQQVQEDLRAERVDVQVDDVDATGGTGTARG